MVARIFHVERDDDDRHLHQTDWDRSVARGRVTPRPGNEPSAVIRPRSRIRQAIKRALDYRVVPGSVGPTSRRLNDERFDADGEDLDP